jgi:predicted house-cleaning noncanonical NTP pyrophosphatase (MazG superfamily)
MSKVTRTFRLNKLVRDKIVQNHLDSGGKVKFRRLAKKEKRQALANKIVEEAKELATSKEILEELADLQEVIDQLAKDDGITKFQITAVQKKKRASNGGFENGDFIEQESWKEGHKWAKYYASDPKIFPGLNKKELKIYVAGKVRKESVFGTHHWREEFVAELEELSGIRLENLDPTKNSIDQGSPEAVFGADAHMISQTDVVVVYLTDDISVGGSQEILIAKYYKKSVIGLAPRGGKFNGATREYFGKVIKDYKDPFVFTTCDVVCATVEEVAKTLQNIDQIVPKDLSMIDMLANKYNNQ